MSMHPTIPFHGQSATAVAEIRRALEPLRVTLTTVVFELEIKLRCDRCGAEWTHEHPLPPFWAECWRCPREEGRA